MSGGFEVIYILSSELFPTVVRNVGMGTSSACARAGSMLAPYIAQLVRTFLYMYYITCRYRLKENWLYIHYQL